MQKNLMGKVKKKITQNIRDNICYLSVYPYAMQLHDFIKIDHPTRVFDNLLFKNP